MAWRNVFVPGAVWLIGTVAIRYLRHGVVIREDVLDALVLSAVVTVVGFVVEFWRERRRARAAKSDAV